MDRRGNVVGVVTSRLDMKAARITGTLPQNVNFAVNDQHSRGSAQMDGAATVLEIIRHTSTAHRRAWHPYSPTCTCYLVVVMCVCVVVTPLR